MNSNFTLDALRPEDHDAVARLLHRSLVHWYDSRLNQGARFGDSHEPFRLFPEVYEALDPGQAVAVRPRRVNHRVGVASSKGAECSSTSSRSVLATASRCVTTSGG